MTTATSPTTRPPRWRTGHAVLTVLVIAAAARLWALGSIPLIITNDSTGYLGNARQIAAGETLTIAPVRTPGYPVFLAAILDVFGISPVGVLMGHHVLGVLMCLLITVTASRLSPWPRAGPALATIAGGLAALDPWILGLESFALTEAISAFLMTLAFAIAARPARPAWPLGLLLGLVLGYACLVRPTFQVVVPFMAIGWLWGTWLAVRGLPLAWLRIAAAAVAIAIGVAGPTVPWLRYNRARGIEGFARGADTLFIAGIARAGLLDEHYPKLTEKHRTAFEELRPAPWDETRIFAFLAKADGWHNAESKRDLLAWAKHSIREHPGRYLGTLGYALLWQLNRFPPEGPIRHNETAGYIGRLGADGTRPPYTFSHPNFQFNDQSYDMTPYSMPAPRGPLARFYTGLERAWLRNRWLQGLPQIPLFIAAVWLGAVCVLRQRTWGLALVIAGTGAFFAVHIVMVLPFSRYALPAWAVWYTTLPLFIPYTVALFRRAPASEVPGEGTIAAAAGRAPAPRPANDSGPAVLVEPNPGPAPARARSPR